MTKVTSRQALAISVLILSHAGRPSEASDDAKFLPFMGPRIEAARYSPAEADFGWVGWIGVTLDLVEKGKWTLFFDPDVETILGHRVRSFEAVQANYSLEVGASRDLGRGRISPFFHHVSRHVQDREKPEAVDWNFLGVRLDSPWPEGWKRRGAWSASLAVATLASAVEYKWEARLSGDIDFARGPMGALFVLADFRHVGAAATPDFPRDRFTDVRAEVGLRRFQQPGQVALFVAYERRNDTLIQKGLVTTRALFGFRIRGQRRETPAVVPLP